MSFSIHGGGSAARRASASLYLCTKAVDVDSFCTFLFLRVLYDGASQKLPVRFTNVFHALRVLQRFYMLLLYARITFPMCASEPLFYLFRQKQKSNFLVIAKATLLFIWSLHHSQRACVRVRSETKSARVFFRRTDEREKVRQPAW